MSSTYPIMYSDDESPDQVTPSRYGISQPGPELKFFMISNPAEAKTPGNKKLVRSHVARTSHAKSRHANASNRYSKRAEHSAAGAMHNMQFDEYDTITEDFLIDPSLSSATSSVVTCQNRLSPPASSFSPLDHKNLGAPTFFIGPLSSWEQFLLNYYVTEFIPSRHNPCDHPSRNFDVAVYRQGMTVQWVSFCLTDIGLFKGILLTSCWSLSKKQRDRTQAERYEQRALQYRGECLRHASETMPRDGQPVTDNAIGMSGHLSFTEYMMGDYEQADQHLSAVEYMIKVKGGLHTLGLNGFLAQLSIWFREELSVAGADAKGRSKGKRKAQG